MKVLVACEESQRVCIAFRDKGHEADLAECACVSGVQRDEAGQAGRISRRRAVVGFAETQRAQTVVGRGPVQYRGIFPNAGRVVFRGTRYPRGRKEGKGMSILAGAKGDEDNG